MSKYLSADAWKTIVKDSKGKVVDNGLLRTLEKYASRPEDKHAARMEDLKQAFKLALALNNTTKKLAHPPAALFLSKLCEAAVKTQEALAADKKAAAVSETDKIMLRGLVAQAATNVSTNAKANAALFGQQVEGACAALDAYASSKLKSMKGGVSAFDLLGPLAAVVTGGISASLVLGVVDDIGRTLVKEMAKQAEMQMRRQASSVAKDSEDLEHAVKLLKVGAHDAALAMSNIVANRIIRECTRVVSEVNSGKRLSDQLTAFIEPFIQADPSTMDKLLEQRFGLPTPAKSKDTYAKLYRQLVERFEVSRIKATTPSGEKMRWVVTGVPDSVRRNAEALAKQAGKQREHEMSAVERGAGR